MERSSQRAVQLFRRTRDFLARTAPKAAYGAIATPVDELGSAADRIAAAAIEVDTRDRAARSGTKLIKQRSRTLRLEYMLPVTRVARIKFRNDPALLTALSMPRNVRQPEALVAAANAMANTAEGHKETFVKGGLPEDFVAQLREAANEILQIIDQRAQDVARRSAASAAVQGEVVRGKGFMGLLDSMVSLRFEGEPSAAAEWRSLMRQGRLRKPLAEEGAGAGGEPAGGGEVKAAA